MSTRYQVWANATGFVTVLVGTFDTEVEAQDLSDSTKPYNYIETIEVED